MDLAAECQLRDSNRRYRFDRTAGRLVVGLTPEGRIRVALSAFDDKSRPPAPGDLARVLGPALRPWNDLIAQIEATYPPITQQWNFAGARYGWSLRLKCKDRVVLSMTPRAARWRR